MAVTLITAIATGFGAAAGIAGMTFSWAAFAISAGFSLVARALTPKPDLGTQIGGQSVMTRDAAQSRKIIYGRTRVGANVVYLESTGADNKYLWLVAAVAAHEIDGYESVWFNDKKIWSSVDSPSGYLNNYQNRVQIRFFTGSQTVSDNANDSTSLSPRTDNLVNASNNKWTTDHKLLDTAYMVIRLEHDVDKFSSGLPNISTIIRGKKVLDLTNSTTAGNFVVGTKYKILSLSNSGTATNFTAIGAASNTVGLEFRATGVGAGTGQARIFSWSQNNALCLYDYLRDAKYGLGEIDDNILISSVITAKSVCDQPISLSAGGNQPRYTINGVVDTAGTLKSNIEIITGSMAGRLVYSGGKFEIHAGQYVAPAFTVDESQIIGDITVQTKQSRRNAFNGVKGVFLSEDDNYILTDYPAQISSAFAVQDGDPIYLDMALPFTTNNIRAQRLAKLALLRSRQQEAITIPCNLSALRFTIGDNINVTNVRLGYSQKVFEVVGYSVGSTSDGQIVVNVQAIETAASIWNWQSSDEEVFLGGGEVALYDGVIAKPPTSLAVTAVIFETADGTVNSSFQTTWTASADAFVDRYVVEWRLASPANQPYFSQETRLSPFRINNLESSKAYNVRVKAINELGVSSTYASVDRTSVIDTTAPSVPSSISATAGFQSISLQWTNPSQKDFTDVEIYRAPSSGGTYAPVSSISAGVGAKVEHLDGDLADATEYHYKFKSVDYTGNKSAFSGIVTATTYKIDTANIADNAVENAQIDDNAVDTDQIADEAVEINQIANSLQSTNYSSGSAGWKILKSGVVEFEQATIRGNITATTGVIGGFTVGSTSLIAGANATRVSLSTATGIHLGHNTFASAPFRVDRAGIMNAKSLTIDEGVNSYIRIKGSSDSGVTLSTDSDYRLWVGGITGALAKFAVHKDGTLTARGMELQDGTGTPYFNASGFTDLAFSEIAANTSSRINSFESNFVYNLQSVKVTIIGSTSLTLSCKASNLFSGLDLSSVAVSGGAATSIANAIADIPNNFTLKIQKSLNNSSFTDVASQTYTKVTSGNSSGTTYRVDAVAQVPSGTTAYRTTAEVNVSNHASVTGLDASGDRSLSNTATYPADVYWFRVQISTTDSATQPPNSSLNNLTTWPRVLGVNDNSSTGFNVISISPPEITQAVGAGDITSVTAGTNLNGGGTSGAVTLNLDSTISGDHTFSANLVIGGNLTVNGTTTTVDTDNLNVKDKNITLNYSTGDSSSTANGAGITIQDAVDASNNATILWNTSGNKFDFSHQLTAPSLNVGGAIEFNSLSGTGSVSITDILDQDNMSSNSATALATQQSIKAYVLANINTGSFLPLSGGSLTGTLSSNSNIETTLDMKARILYSKVTNNSYLDLNSSNNVGLNASGAVNLTVGGATKFQARSTGALVYAGSLMMGSNATVVIDASRNITAANLTAAVGSGNVLINQSSVTYTNTDNSSLIATPMANVLHVNGSIQMKENNSAIVFGRGTSTFLQDEELAFGWGGGIYMTDVNWLRIRNNKGLYTTGILNGGSLQIANTTVIDGSRNLTNIGTISSGAITSSGGVSGTTATFTNSVTLSGSGIVNITKGLGLYVSANLSVSGLIFKNGGGDVEVSGNLRINSGGLKIGTTTVIDASRNLTNIGTIAIGSASPQNSAKVDIYSSVTSGHFNGLQIRRPNSSGITSAMQFTLANNIMVGKIQHDYVASNHNDMSFHLRLSGGGNQEVMRFYAGPINGTRVGIGTTQPEEKLTVSGNIRASGSYLVGGTTVINASRALTNIASYNGYLPTASSSSTNSVVSLDSRSVNSSPSARNSGLYVDFKNQSTIGLTGSGTYAGVLTFRAYGGGTDLSGGYPIQIAYDHAGSLQTRIGSSATAWNAWKAIHVAGNNLTAGTISSGAITSSGLLTVNAAIQMNRSNGTGDSFNMDNVRNSTWPFVFRSYGVGNDNHSGFWIGSQGYPDMRLRRDGPSVTALFSSWEMSFVNNGFNVNAGNFQIGGTTVIDASRNLTNIGTITATGNSGIGITPNTQKLSVGGQAQTRVQIDGSSTSGVYFTIGGANGATIRSGSTNNLEFYTTNLAATIDSSMNFNISSGALQVGSTTVIDASRNLTNVGTINSGAITSSGDIKTSGTALGVTQTDGDYLAKLYQAGADGILELFTGQATPLSRIKLHSYSTSYINPASGGLGLGVTTVGSGQKLNVGGGIGISGTTVIDASRNLINLANITQTSGFSIYLGTKTRLSSDNNGEVGLNYGTTSGTASTSLAIYNNTTKTISLNRNGTITSGAITTSGLLSANAGIDMQRGNNTGSSLNMASVRSSTWPFEFTSYSVGNDNSSGFWLGSQGYPDMRLRRDSSTVTCLISSWEMSFVNNGFNVNAGELQIGGTTVITSGRAITNCTGITLTGGSISSYGSVTAGLGSFLVGSRGKMGQVSNDLFVCSTTSQHSGLRFANGAIHPTDNTGAQSDSAQIDLGASSYRFNDIYARNGTINTSDRNEKQDIEVLSAAEQRVAVAAKGLLRKFRWKDAVLEKGDSARIHFGIVAQDLQAAFVAEGLDAGRYGMFTSDTWDEDGVDQTRMGVRYSELLAFIISAI